MTLVSYRLRGVVTFVSDKYPDEYMFLYTADGFEGVLGECSEGQLEWVKKEKIRELPLWEGDLIFFELLKDELSLFLLKACIQRRHSGGSCLKRPGGRIAGRAGFRKPDNWSGEGQIHDAPGWDASRKPLTYGW